MKNDHDNEFLKGDIYSIGYNDLTCLWCLEWQRLKGWKVRLINIPCYPEMWTEGNMIIWKDWLKLGEEKEGIGKNKEVFVTYIECTKFMFWTNTTTKINKYIIKNI